MLARSGNRLTILFPVRPFYGPRISKRHCFFRTSTFCNSPLFQFDQLLATPRRAFPAARRVRFPCRPRRRAAARCATMPATARPTPTLSRVDACRVPPRVDGERLLHRRLQPPVGERLLANDAGAQSLHPFEAAPSIILNSLFNMVFTPVSTETETAMV